MLALPYTCPMPSQNWGMIAFTKFFWEIFISNKRRSRNFFGKFFRGKKGLLKFFWEIFRGKKRGVMLANFILGIFQNKKTLMSFFKNFSGEFFGVKKCSLYIGDFL